MADVLMPDMGSDDPVDVAEILVKIGDNVQVEDSLVVVESAKASLEVPSTAEGTIIKIHAAVGQSLNPGDLLLTLAEADAGTQEKTQAPQSAAPASTIEALEQPATTTSQPASAQPAVQATEQELTLPDIGGDAADVIELCVEPGARVEKDQTLIVLESAKATVEVPADSDGVLVNYLIKLGDSVNEGTPYIVFRSEQAADNAPTTQALSSSTNPPSTEAAEKKAVQNNTDNNTPTAQSPSSPTNDGQNASNGAGKTQGLNVNLSTEVHAGPAVRRLANKLGVALNLVKASGPRGRILKEDVHGFVKAQLTHPQVATSDSSGLPSLPVINFEQYGEVEEVALTKIQNMSAQNLHRAWVNIPHVTQFDEADITDLEAFRKSLGEEYKAQGIKITMLAFMIKASTIALKKFPKFNASLHADGQTLIQKKYCHVGFAADTPFGLVVPVIKDADQLSVVEIAQQLGALSAKARDKKLAPRDMQGGCFSVSSLGGIGGTAFTPIVNWPEVAILGVSRAALQPKWQGSGFEPRLILPLSLSYDHRVIDGADAARFAQFLVKLLSDSRRMLL